MHPFSSFEIRFSFSSLAQLFHTYFLESFLQLGFSAFQCLFLLDSSGDFFGVPPILPWAQKVLQIFICLRCVIIRFLWAVLWVPRQMLSFYSWSLTDQESCSGSDFSHDFSSLNSPKLEWHFHSSWPTLTSLVVSLDTSPPAAWWLQSYCCLAAYPPSLQCKNPFQS